MITDNSSGEFIQGDTYFKYIKITKDYTLALHWLLIKIVNVHCLFCDNPLIIFYLLRRYFAVSCFRRLVAANGRFKNESLVTC